MNTGCSKFLKNIPEKVSFLKKIKMTVSFKYLFCAGIYNLHLCKVVSKGICFFLYLVNASKYNRKMGLNSIFIKICCSYNMCIIFIKLYSQEKNQKKTLILGGTGILCR